MAGSSERKIILDHPTAAQCIEAIEMGMETERWCKKRQAWISSNDDPWVVDRNWSGMDGDKVMTHQRIVLGG